MTWGTDVGKMIREVEKWSLRWICWDHKNTQSALGCTVTALFPQQQPLRGPWHACVLYDFMAALSYSYRDMSSLASLQSVQLQEEQMLQTLQFCTHFLHLWCQRNAAYNQLWGNPEINRLTSLHSHCTIVQKKGLWTFWHICKMCPQQPLKCHTICCSHL